MKKVKITSGETATEISKDKWEMIKKWQKKTGKELWKEVKEKKKDD